MRKNLKICESKIYAPPILELRKTDFCTVNFFYRVRDFPAIFPRFLAIIHRVEATPAAALEDGVCYYVSVMAVWRHVPHTVLECHASEMNNNDARPRPTAGGPRRQHGRPELRRRPRRRDAARRRRRARRRGRATLSWCEPPTSNGVLVAGDCGAHHVTDLPLPLESAQCEV
jgi:hypothetical protein